MKRRRRVAPDTMALLTHHVLDTHAQEVGREVRFLLIDAGFDAESCDDICIANAILIAVNDSAMKCIGMSEDERAGVIDFPLVLVR